MTLPLEFDGPRLMRPDEAPDSERLFRDAFGFDDAEVNPESEMEEAKGEVAVFAHNGRLVSQVGMYPERLVLDGAEIRVGSIGGVGTHPDYRGHGLASQLLEFSARRLREAGTHIFFISGGRGLYRRLGCEPAGLFHRFLLRPGQAARTSPAIRLRPAEESDAAACLRLYQNSRAHFCRSESAFVEHFRIQTISYRAEKWIVEAAGAPVAYLLLNIPWDFMEQPGSGVRSVFEYAGEPAALCAALTSLASEHGLSELEFLAAWQDQSLSACLSATAGPPELAPLPDHTLRILHFPGLMQSLEPVFAAKLGAKTASRLRFEQTGPLLGGSGGDRCAIHLGEETLALDGSAMSRLVFGDFSGADPASALPGGALREALDAVFPLPAFFAGLNYH